MTFFCDLFYILLDYNKIIFMSMFSSTEVLEQTLALLEGVAVRVCLPSLAPRLQGPARRCRERACVCALSPGPPAPAVCCVRVVWHVDLHDLPLGNSPGNCTGVWHAHRLPLCGPGLAPVVWPCSGPWPACWSLHGFPLHRHMDTLMPALTGTAGLGWAGQGCLGSVLSLSDP